MLELASYCVLCTHSLAILPTLRGSEVGGIELLRRQFRVYHQRLMVDYSTADIHRFADFSDVWNVVAAVLIEKVTWRALIKIALAEFALVS